MIYTGNKVWFWRAGDIIHSGIALQGPIEFSGSILLNSVTGLQGQGTADPRQGSQEQIYWGWGDFPQGSLLISAQARRF